MIRTLLIEDDIDLASTIVDYLVLDEIDCDHASNGVAGLNLARSNDYDVMLLDINLPRMDGLSVCRSLRDDGVDLPVLMLTAMDTINDKVEGFNAGTDDYLVKPFAFVELIARIKALSNRKSGQVKRLQVQDLIMDLNQHKVWREERELSITPTGWSLLEKLMRHSPDVVSRSDLEDIIWPNSHPDSDAFKVHLYKLRNSVDKSFDIPLIHTIAGVGVRCGEPLSIEQS
jgi:DNA-binding response OmpR family regulator